MIDRRLCQGLFLGLMLLGSRAPVAAADGDGILDRLRLDYRDHEDERSNAGVLAVLRRDGGEFRLDVLVSAVGPPVEPPRGFEGLRGSNRITAEELDMLMRGRRRLAGAALAESGTLTWGSFRETRRGRLPRRRLLPSGRIDYHASSAGELPLELLLAAPLSGDGLHFVEWRVDGQPRLRVVVEVRGDGGRVLRADALDPAPLAAGSAIVLASQRRDDGFVASRQDPGGEEPPAPPVDLAEWGARDLEARWVLLARSLDEEPARGAEWVRFLAARGELELLEWTALYRPRTFYTLEIGKVLQELDAPQWVRLAVWTLESSDGHTLQSAEAKLLLGRPERALAWFRRHPAAIAGRAAALRGELEKVAGEGGAAEGLLPPLDRATVFAHLEPPDRLADLGDRRRAEPGVVYVHQVLRAIDALGARRDPAPELLEKLDRLTRHADLRVKQKAFLAYSHLFPELIPRQALLEAARSAAEPPLAREAALLAYSYSEHPEVYLELHHVAFDARHPAWRAAVSRLGDLGDAFTLEVLEGRKLPPGEAAFLETELERLRARVADERRRLPRSLLPVLVPRLERAAWADLRCDPLEGPLVRWTLDSVREHAGDAAVRARLEKLRAYRARVEERTPWGSLEGRVREYVEGLLAGESPGARGATR